VLRVVANLYDRFMSEVEEAGLSKWRSELLAGLAGEVLEVGAGTGRNIELYPPDVRGLVLTEPDRHMRALLERAVGGRDGVTIANAPAEHLPFADERFDAAVSTLVLCSVRDPAAALSELYRVLRPGGKLVFIEHVAARDRPRRLLWQRRLEPFWRRLAGNCHLTRDTEQEIVSGGFEIVEIERQSMRKALAIIRPTVRGIARRPAAA